MRHSPLVLWLLVPTLGCNRQLRADDEAACYAYVEAGNDCLAEQGTDEAEWEDADALCSGSADGKTPKELLDETERYECYAEWYDATNCADDDEREANLLAMQECGP